jgi:hypothetical protein
MKRIDAVQIVRAIRDRQNKAIKNKSSQEMIEYFRKKAAMFDKNSETTSISMR